jgi:predicted DNA-binding transcriptional regulator AlpA
MSHNKSSPVALNAPVTKGYLRTIAAAQYLDIGKSTLERKRIDGAGPKFRILGSKIVIYAITDLDAWASQQVLSSTAEKAGGLACNA